MSSVASDDVATLLTHALSTSGIEAALAVDTLIDHAITSLETMSHRGRIVPELAARGISSYRELVPAPYRIVYRVEQEEIWVLVVADARRDLDGLLVERARR